MTFDQLATLCESSRKVEDFEFVRYFASYKMMAQNKPSEIKVTPPSEAWVDENNLLHRDDGPAFITKDDDGRIVSLEYYRHGLEHRDDGPALIEFFENGKKHAEYWVQNGFLHNTKGPARIIYSYDGNEVTIRDYYFIKGEMLSDEEFHERYKDVDDDARDQFEDMLGGFE